MAGGAALLRGLALRRHSLAGTATQHDLQSLQGAPNLPAPRPTHSGLAIPPFSRPQFANKCALPIGANSVSQTRDRSSLSGCEMTQGHLFSRPLPADLAGSLLENPLISRRYARIGYRRIGRFRSFSPSDRRTRCDKNGRRLDGLVVDLRSRVLLNQVRLCSVDITHASLRLSR
jgi:hypothetical protein